jgi:hypothetical protein
VSSSVGSWVSDVATTGADKLTLAALELLYCGGGYGQC